MNNKTPKIPFADLELKVYQNTKDASDCLARFKGQPIFFFASSPFQAAQKANAWRDAELAKLGGA